MSINKPTRTKIIVREGLTKDVSDVKLLSDVAFSVSNKMKALKELNEWMLKNNMSIRKTAVLIGMNNVTLARLIKGKNVPYDRTAYKIKEFLKKHKIK